MTKEDLEEIFSCSECTTILTDNDWSETYSVPLTMTVKELRDLHKTLPTNDSLLNSNKHEPQVIPRYTLSQDVKHLEEKCRYLKNKLGEIIATIEVNYRRGTLRIVGDESRMDEAKTNFENLLKQWKET